MFENILSIGISKVLIIIFENYILLENKKESCVKNEQRLHKFKH